MTDARSRSPITAIAPAQKTFPMTAASARIDFASVEHIQASRDEGLDRIRERTAAPLAKLPGSCSS